MLRNIYVHMPGLTNPDYVEKIEAMVFNANEDEVDFCLLLDFHDNHDMYHGPPPHLLDMVMGRKKTQIGYGYAPFGWTRGWIWMRNAIVELLEQHEPVAIQYGEAPHIRSGWDFLNDNRWPDVAFYNDTLGILKEALDESSYLPDLVIIPTTPGSGIQKRGMKRAIDIFPDAITIVKQNEVIWEDEQYDDYYESVSEDDDEIVVVVDEDIIWPDLPVMPTWVAGNSEAVKFLKRAKKQINKAIKLL